MVKLKNKGKEENHGTYRPKANVFESLKELVAQGLLWYLVSYKLKNRLFPKKKSISLFYFVGSAYKFLTLTAQISCKSIFSWPKRPKREYKSNHELLCDLGIASLNGFLLILKQLIHDFVYAKLWNTYVFTAFFEWTFKLGKKLNKIIFYSNWCFGNGKLHIENWNPP